MPGRGRVVPSWSGPIVCSSSLSGGPGLTDACAVDRLRGAISHAPRTPQGPGGRPRRSTKRVKRLTPPGSTRRASVCGVSPSGPPGSPVGRDKYLAGRSRQRLPLSQPASRLRFGWLEKPDASAAGAQPTPASVVGASLRPSRRGADGFLCGNSPGYGGRADLASGRVKFIACTAPAPTDAALHLVLRSAPLYPPGSSLARALPLAVLPLAASAAGDWRNGQSQTAVGLPHRETCCDPKGSRGSPEGASRSRTPTTQRPKASSTRPQRHYRRGRPFWPWGSRGRGKRPPGPVGGESDSQSGDTREVRIKRRSADQDGKGTPTANPRFPGPVGGETTGQSGTPEK